MFQFDSNISSRCAEGLYRVVRDCTDHWPMFERSIVLRIAYSSRAQACSLFINQPIFRLTKQMDYACVIATVMIITFYQTREAEPYFQRACVGFHNSVVDIANTCMIMWWICDIPGIICHEDVEKCIWIEMLINIYISEDCVSNAIPIERLSCMAFTKKTVLMV